MWSRPAGWSGTLEQAWFPGVHSNVGGGYKPDGLANEALHWIVSKAESVGLDVDWSYLAHFEPHCDSKLHDSMSMKYRLMGPGTRTIGDYAQHGECVHKATADRMARTEIGYKPKNLTAAARNLPVVSTDPRN